VADSVTDYSNHHETDDDRQAEIQTEHSTDQTDLNYCIWTIERFYCVFSDS